MKTQIKKHLPEWDQLSVKLQKRIEADDKKLTPLFEVTEALKKKYGIK